MQNVHSDAVLLKEQYRDSTNLDARIALHARFSMATRGFHAWVFDHFDFPDHARVLEVGGGTGLLWMLRENRERVPATWRLTLSDFSVGMLETARATGTAANFVQSDVQAVPFPAVYFDAVIANHMLYHVPDLPRALAEIRRVLQVGGKFYAATNGANHMRELGLLTSELGLQFPGFERLSFDLENGAQHLSNYFADVRRFDFEDSLMVTEIEPLVAYVKSMRLATQLLSNELEQRLREIIADRIAREGAFRITKAAGLFVARAG